MQGDALSPPLAQDERLRVGGKRLGAEPAKEPHHGKVELAMTAMCRRIDQPIASLEADQTVAAPEVAVQAGWRLRVTAQLAQSSGDRV